MRATSAPYGIGNAAMIRALCTLSVFVRYQRRAATYVGNARSRAARPGPSRTASQRVDTEMAAIDSSVDPELTGCSPYSGSSGEVFASCSEGDRANHENVSSHAGLGLLERTLALS